MGVLDRDAHVLEGVDGLPAEVLPHRVRAVIEVADIVDRDGIVPGRRVVLEQEELDLRVGVERETLLGGFGQLPLEDPPRIGVGGGTVGQQDVAEDAGDWHLLAPPGQHLEAGWIGLGEHVGFGDAAEALDGRAVETDALGESALEFRRRDRDRFQDSQHVSEPQSHESDVALFDRAQHVLCLPVHAPILP